MFENGTVQTVGFTMTEMLTQVKIFWPQGLRCQSVERPDDQNRVKLLRQVRNPARERSRNLNREVWESPSVLRRRGCQLLGIIKGNSKGIEGDSANLRIGA